MLNDERRIVVFEARPRWEPELQRQFVGERVRVVGCRTLNELPSRTISSDTSRSGLGDVIVIVVPDEAIGVLEWLQRRQNLHQTRSAIILLLSDAAAPLEWPLRDAGAAQVIIGELTGRRLAHCCRCSFPCEPPA